MQLLKLSCLFISSYFPLYIFIGIIKYESLLSVFFGEKNFLSQVLFFVLLVLVIISILVAIVIKWRNINSNQRIITHVERDSDSIISYIFTYIIPIMSAFNDTSISNSFLGVNLLLFLMVWYLYIKLSVLYLNPLLAAIGYIPYRINDGIILTDITYNELLEFKQLGIGIQGESIVSGIFLAKRKDNKLPSPE